MYDGVFINPLFGFSAEDSPIEEDVFRTLNDDEEAVTEIHYAGSGLAEVCKVGNDDAPSPLISISKSFIQNDAGITTAIEDTLDIEGYIIATGVATGRGPDDFLTAASGLEDLFVKNPVAKLQIKCESDVLYQLDSARVTDLALNKSPNNWTQYLQYNISIVGVNSGLTPGLDQYPVKNTVDSWSIEPVTELVNFEHIVMNAKIKTGNNATANKKVQEYNLPRFKVNHRVSANGIRSKNEELTEDTQEKAYRDALENAGKWVSGRLAVAETGDMDRAVAPRDSEHDANRKYEFVRSVNFDLSTALYEVNDTWISMPSGSLFTEEYSIEVSTNEKYEKTIRVNGSIQGNISPSSSFVKTGLPISWGTSSGDVDLSRVGGVESAKISGNVLAPHTGNVTSWSSMATTGTSRFDNASTAWHGSGTNAGGIKNLLYWRASSALNASKAGIYTETFVPANYNKFSQTNNPINSRESLLNLIPVSTSETYDPKAGSVSYSYEFTNKLSAISGALTESITINDTGPTDVLAEVFVLGRKLGPVLQNLGAKTTTTRDVSIDLTVMPPTGFNGYFMTQTGCPLYTGGSIYQLVETMVSGLRPFGPRDGSVFPGGTRTQLTRGQVFVRRDDETWNPAEGRYSRSLSWAYQQCNTDDVWNDI